MTALEDAKALVQIWETDSDEFKRAQLCGYLSVVAVREFELQIKNILIQYAHRCHSSFGMFVTQDLGRLNGRIGIEDINLYLGKFGGSIKQKFVDLHQRTTTESLAEHKLDAVNAYNSLISNRHAFVHTGNLTLSLPEVRRYIELAPRVIECVDRALALVPSTAIDRVGDVDSGAVVVNRDAADLAGRVESVRDKK